MPVVYLIRELDTAPRHRRGSATTPFEMTALNELDRFQLAPAAAKRVTTAAANADEVNRIVAAKLAEHDAYIRRHGDDLPEIRAWKWPGSEPLERR